MPPARTPREPAIPAAPPMGIHLALGRGLLRAAGRALEIGATTVQVFVDNPTAWKRRTRPPRHFDEFRARLAGAGVAPVAVHASYLVNLGGHEPTFRANSIDVLASDMAAAVGYGARFVTVHTGSHRGTSLDAGARRVAEGIAEVLARSAGDASAPVLALENASGSGDAIGATFAELARVAGHAAALGVSPDRLAFCVDTAHAWGAGYGVDEPEGVEALLREFDRELGLDRLAIVHLNDSRSERGSRHDRHEHIGGGRVGTTGLAHLLRHPRLRSTPFILETPGMDDGYDLVNLERARALHAGEALAPLPPEAFLLSRQSRAAAPAEGDVAP